MKAGNIFDKSFLSIPLEKGMTVSTLIIESQLQAIDHDVNEFDELCSETSVFDCKLIEHGYEYIDNRALSHQTNNIRCHATSVLELLAFGKKFPDIQRQIPIYSTRSYLQNAAGECAIPVLSVVGTRRCIGLHGSATKLPSSYAVLVRGKAN